MTPGHLSADFSRTVKFEPDTARLAEIRRFVQEVASDAALDPEQVFDLKVAVSEACANAVEHGGRQTSLLEVSASREAGRLTFTVTDNGTFHAPMSGPGDNHRRGLGLPLMVALMDAVTFSRPLGGGTTVSLSVIIAPEET
jgi:anti-sigma regulatory factor (Ser/Thr protein kinase)